MGITLFLNCLEAVRMCISVGCRLHVEKQFLARAFARLNREKNQCQITNELSCVALSDGVSHTFDCLAEIFIQSDLL